MKTYTAIISDIHLHNFRAFGGKSCAGINGRAQLVLDTLQDAFHVAELSEVTDMFILGDLFETTRPEPQLIAAVGQVFTTTNMMIHILVGNHEQCSTQQGDHALGPLELLRNVDVIDTPRRVWPSCLPTLALPFTPEEPLDALRTLFSNTSWPDQATPRMLLMHEGIRTKDTPAFIPGGIGFSALQDLCEENEIKYALSGHWHEHMCQHMLTGKDETMICQVGALCPRSFQDSADPQFYGKLAMLGDGAVSTVTIPGPRFIKATSFDDLDVQRMKCGEDDTIYVRLFRPAEEMTASHKVMEEYVVKNGLAGGEVVPVAVDTTTLVEETAEVIRRATEGIEHTLHIYVELTLVNKPVEFRELVEARVLESLKAAT